MKKTRAVRAAKPNPPTRAVADAQPELPARAVNIMKPSPSTRASPPTKTTESSAAVATRPFLKWAGSKRSAAQTLLGWLPPKIERYFEPMVGGGALFFALARDGRFQQAFLNDTNAELMTTYDVIRNQVDDLVQVLSMLTYDKAVFLRLRAQEPEKLSPLLRAARMIYLNRTCFNGLFRVNKQGQFNVPFGRYTNPKILDEPNLRAVSAALQGVSLNVADFAELTRWAGPGDAIYADPPYLPVSKTANFTAYGPGAFGLKEHERLAAEFARLARAGVAVLLTNSDTETTRALYREFEIRTIQARRNINSNAKKRGTVSEIVVLANCGDGVLQT